MASIRHARIRNPSTRALEIAQAADLPTTTTTTAATTRRAPSSRNKAPPAAPPAAAPTATTAPPAAAAAKGKAKAAKPKPGPPPPPPKPAKSRATKRGGKKPDEVLAHPAPAAAAAKKRTTATISPTQGDDDDKEPDLTLYCICLGFDTGEQPMIQCNACENWFHFQCVNLTDAEAAKIETYFCDICEGMGLGHKTRYTQDAEEPEPVASSSTSSLVDDPDSDAHMPSPSDAEQDDDDDDDDAVHAEATGDEEDDDDDDEYASGEDGRRRKRTGKKSDGSAQKRRKVVAAPLAEPDEEYVGDAALDHSRSGRARGKRTQPRVVSTTSARSPPAKEAQAPRAEPLASPVAAAGTSSGAAISSTSSADKTRTHCVKQLATIFTSIFAASEDDANSIGVQARAAAFAETIEAELFDGFGEVDAKGVKGPRTKYIAKFRSLHYNLKSNAAFRSRISANELAPTQIVNMSQEDLLTPELRAMAESVRAASLKHSVKEVLAAPTAKRTHKGEEEIDNFAAGTAAEDELLLERREIAQRERQVRDRSTSIAQGSPVAQHSPSFAQQYSPGRQQSSPGPYGGSLQGSPPVVRELSPAVASPGATSAASPDVHSPSVPEEPTPALPVSNATPAAARPRTSLSHAPLITTDFGLDLDSPEPEPEPAPLNDEAMPPPPRPAAPRQRSSFDMAAVWGQIKPSPTLPSSETMQDPAPDSGEPGATEEPSADDFDPFDLPARAAADDEFEAALLRGDEATSRSPAKSNLTKSTIPPFEAPPPPSAPPAPTSSVPPLSELDPIWVGDLIVPNEGGFPAFGVQLGGRAFGSAPVVWNQLLPRGLTMDGRIPTPTASKYLVECSFAPTRELVIVGILPDQTGPTEQFPHKPNGPSCLAKYEHVMDFYVKKDRIGVIAPPETLKRVVKDIYIIPLKKSDPLPEYIELLDEHNIPETGARDQDILLCVLVIQKGALPSLQMAPRASVPTPPPAIPLPAAPSSAGPVASGHFSPPQAYNSAPSYPPQVAAAPSLDPATLQSLLKSVDPNGLSSLLAHPSMLQSLAANPPAAPPPGPIPTGPRNGTGGYGRPPPGPIMAPVPSSSHGGFGYAQPYPSPGPPPFSGGTNGSSSPPRKAYVHPSRQGLVPEQPASAGSFESRWDGGGYPPAPGRGGSGSFGGDSRARPDRGGYGGGPERGGYGAGGPDRGGYGQRGRGGAPFFRGGHDRGSTPRGPRGGRGASRGGSF